MGRGARRKLCLMFVDDDEWNHCKGPSSMFLCPGQLYGQASACWMVRSRLRQHPENCAVLGCLRGWSLTPTIASTASCITRMWCWAILKWALLHQAFSVCLLGFVSVLWRNKVKLCGPKGALLSLDLWAGLIQNVADDVLTNNTLYCKQSPYILDMCA